MENKQTAVEWAEDKLSDLNSAVVNGEIAPEEYHEIRVNIWKKAKAMEKEQSIKDYKAGAVGEIWELNIDESAESYYNKTYANDTTKGLPEENSKRRGWHY
jgi:hypothetical protein